MLSIRSAVGQLMVVDPAAVVVVLPRLPHDRVEGPWRTETVVLRVRQIAAGMMAHVDLTRRLSRHDVAVNQLTIAVVKRERIKVLCHAAPPSSARFTSANP